MNVIEDNVVVVKLILVASAINAGVVVVECVPVVAIDGVIVVVLVLLVLAFLLLLVVLDGSFVFKVVVVDVLFLAGF